MGVACRPELILEWIMTIKPANFVKVVEPRAKGLQIYLERRPSSHVLV